MRNVYVKGEEDSVVFSKWETALREESEITRNC